MRRVLVAALTLGSLWVVFDRAVEACTAFCAVGSGQMLVGNNEDWSNPRTRLWFVAAKPGSYGRMYVGFDDRRPQGGMNERGLWFDGFATPPVAAAAPSTLPSFPGDIVDAAMAQCSTVEEVVRLFSQYDRAFLVQGILMFADASGDAVSIERNAMVRKTRGHFVQTNFLQSLPEIGIVDARFTTASTMLEQAGSAVSLDLFRRILDATHQSRGDFQTLYSNIYDLRTRTMYLYYFHDFTHVVTFHLADELKKGERVLEIPSLFPANAAAAKFSSRRTQSQADGRWFGIAFFALPMGVLMAALYGSIRGGRRGRLALAALAGTMAVLVLSVVAALRMHQPASNRWMEFSIGPASGESASIQPGLIRSTGITLKAVLSTAYEVPTVRIVAPAWVARTRYSLNAVVSAETADSFRSLLQEELKKRLQLETHFEVRPFDVFVLTASGTSRLERSQGKSLRVWLRQRDAEFLDASVGDVASGLQSILGKPVIDETAIAGTYNLNLEWSDDAVAAITAGLAERGLQLSAGTREMEALVVDSIRRDPALMLLGEVGRVTRGAPVQFRQQLAHILTIR